jgi:predicted RNA-binding protein YlqC (UPF0109 family)
MRELVEYLVQGLVERPEEVEVTTSPGGRDTLAIEVRVSPRDAGRIIGKNGKIAAAIRTVAKAAASRTNRRVFVDIVSE